MFPLFRSAVGTAKVDIATSQFGDSRETQRVLKKDDAAKAATAIYFCNDEIAGEERAHKKQPAENRPPSYISLYKLFYSFCKLL